MLTAEWL